MRSLFILLFLFASHNIQSQDSPLIDMDSSYWVVENLYPVLGPGDGYEWWAEFITGDTLYQGKTYKKVNVQNLCESWPDRSNNGEPIVTRPEYHHPVVIGGVREENKKVYFIKFEDLEPYGYYDRIPGQIESGIEFILYDFGAQVGDTIWHATLSSYSILNGDTTFSTKHVRSVVIHSDTVNGKKVLCLDNNSRATWPPNFCWEEGKGSNVGLLTSLHVGDKSRLCYSYNFRKKKPCNPCKNITSIKEHLVREISVYPNPCSSSDVLEFDLESPIAQVDLYDALGNHIARMTPLGNRISLSHFNLKSGFYSVRITSNVNEIYVGSFIVH